MKKLDIWLFSEETGLSFSIGITNLGHKKARAQICYYSQNWPKVALFYLVIHRNGS